MIKTARQLKDLIRNLSKEKSADAQLLMRNYMMERFLERVSLSKYHDKLILKGGMLIAAMVGMESRSTMDLDATAVVTPLKIDISTGDVITPEEMQYSFKLMLEDRSIDILVYNLETVLAEKLETIIRRTTTNTRMRDFYDLYILKHSYKDALSSKILHDALEATSYRRGSEQYLNQANEVFDEVENNLAMQKLWEAYRKKFFYAADLEWTMIMKEVRELYLFSKK